MKLIGRAVMIARINQAIDEHIEGLVVANSRYCRDRGARIAWVGHTQRIEALKATLRKVEKGDPCNRAVAQLFGAGYRIDGDGNVNTRDVEEAEIPF